MKRLSLQVIATFLAIFIGISNVSAKGSANIGYVGEDTINVGETFTVKVKVSDIEGLPIIGIGGRIVFDQEYLEFVSMSGMEEPFPMLYNEKNLIFSGFSFVAKGVVKEADILTITFKAIKEGTTNLSFYEPELSDYNADIIETKEIPYSLTITKKQEETQDNKALVDEVKEDKNSTKEESVKVEENTKVEASKSKNSENKKLEEVKKENTAKTEIKSTTLVNKNDTKMASDNMINILTKFKNVLISKKSVSNSIDTQKPVHLKIGQIISNILSLNIR